MSPSLADIQRGLASWVVGGRPPELVDWSWVPEGVDPNERLAVYADGYPTRVFEALAESFPATATILGDGSFGALVQRYLPWVPRGWCNLNDIGCKLPSFLSIDRLASDLPFLPDLARLERAVYEAFHADVGPALDFSPYASWDLEQWNEARFEFRRDVFWLDSEWPLQDLWDARSTPQSDIDVALEGRPQSVCIHRTGFDVTVSLIDPTEAMLAASFSRGDSFCRAIDELAQADFGGEVAAQLFGRWVEAGLIAAIR